jgi:hypothetical protein
MKNIQPLTSQLIKGATALTVAMVSVGLASQVLAAQFKLGADANNFIDNAPPLSNSYAAPVMVQPMNSAPATYDNTPSRAPMQGNASVALPRAFMGTWSVQGQRSSINAQPEFQKGISGLFPGGTQSTWNISGSPQQGYQMSSDTGVNTPLNIYKVSKNQAFIRYQHPVYKTMAQEAIVLELQSGGATFQGLERIAIIKDGQQPPRATVKYQLFGQRQR